MIARALAQGRSLWSMSRVSIAMLLATVLAFILLVVSLVPRHTASAEDTIGSNTPAYVTTDNTTGASVEVDMSTDESGDQCLDVNVFQLAVDAPTGSFGGCGFVGVLNTVSANDACVDLNRLTQRSCPQADVLNVAPLAGEVAVNGSDPERTIVGALVVVTSACPVTIHFSDGNSVSAVALPSSVASRVGVPFVAFGYEPASPGVYVDRVDATSYPLGVRLSVNEAERHPRPLVVSSLPPS